MWRDFPIEVQRWSDSCRCELFCTEPFDIIGGNVGGGSVAVPIRLRSSMREAWAKPAVMRAGNERTAAHEKIVSDIAHALGFPVAPVLLSRETRGHQGHQLPEIVALSFSALKSPRPWNGLSGALTDAHKKALCRPLAAIIAFHAWIDDHDHLWNEGNALFECDADGKARVVFYDYGHALTHEWAPPAAAPVREWKRRDGPYCHAETHEIVRAIEQIKGLAVTDLQAIIRRVPPECMPVDLAQALVTALDQRRAELEKLLNVEKVP